MGYVLKIHRGTSLIFCKIKMFMIQIKVKRIEVVNFRCLYNKNKKWTLCFSCKKLETLSCMLRGCSSKEVRSKGLCDSLMILF